MSNEVKKALDFLIENNPTKRVMQLVYADGDWAQGETKILNEYTTLEDRLDHAKYVMREAFCNG